MKYEKLAKCTYDTALRDISALVERGILERSPEWVRSIGYLASGGSVRSNPATKRQAGKTQRHPNY